MYLGIDFLINPELKPFVSEVNVGLPGGAQEYDLTHLVHYGRPSDIFRKIEEISQRVYNRPFHAYLHSLPFIESLKPFKIWMDGKGSLPKISHPGLRLEDKWNQYLLISPIAPMPETMIFDPFDLDGAGEFFKRKGKVVLKRRLGRGGRGFRIITDPRTLWNLDIGPTHCLLQEYIESQVSGHTFSIRSIAFGGEFVCMYANLSPRPFSNHGTLAFISPGYPFGLREKAFETQAFNQKSWEAEIWFGDHEPQYLRHNLYEDEVAKTVFDIPEETLQMIKELSVRIERSYENLNLSSIPKACFEK
ncbi:MAG: hypothetical protein HXY46_11375 [Syntrophaceae bacterium]|nr:hypothetical protein [Syntrophaceae bacterium]